MKFANSTLTANRGDHPSSTIAGGGKSTTESAGNYTTCEDATDGSVRVDKDDYVALVVFAGYFAVLLAAAFFIRDAPEAGTFWFTIQDLLAGRVNPYNDPKSFVEAALDIYNTGWVQPEHAWVLRVWPPGFALLEAALLFVFGPDVPIITALQVCAALLFALLLTLVFRLLRPALGPVTAFVAGLVPFAFPVTRTLLLEPTGVSFGETFGVGFFLIGVVLCLAAARRSQPIALAMLAGAALGLSAYFQQRFELYLSTLMVSGVVLVLLVWSRALDFVFRTKVQWQAGMTVVVSSAMAQIVMLPWRLFHYVTANRLTWSVSVRSIYGFAVQMTADLEARGVGSLAEGGGNLVCRLDPSTCGDTAHAKELFYRTLFGHLWEWISIKASLASQYWFAPMGRWTRVGSAPSTADLLINWLFVAIAVSVLLLPLFWRRLKQQPQWLVLVWFAWTLFAAHLAIYTLVHLEARYFHFAKITYVLLFVLMAAMAWAARGAGGQGTAQRPGGQ
jgi:hypothetical protein